MRERPFLAIGSVRDFEVFKSYLSELNLDLAIDKDLVPNDSSPLAQELNYGSIRIGNRFTIHPMEGWDGTPDGRPSDKTVRRWKMFGRSGAKLIWGGEAVAVTHDGRANPNQLLMTKENLPSLLELRETLVREHIESCGSDKGLFVGLQLTHSGRFSRPNASNRPEPRILYRHPILDRRLNLSSDYPLMTDGEIRSLIENFHRSARMAWEAGYEFVDIKHCHGYLGHEFLSSHTRQGDYGGSFENRTRFLREVVEGIRSLVPELKIAVRLSAFDLVPYRPDPDRSRPGKPGPGVPEAFSEHLPYKFGFGVNINDPTKADLDETYRFLSLLNDLDIRLVNITAGSPYYNPHIQRPVSATGRPAGRCSQAVKCLQGD
jgi:NADPH2 dehydrogenase